jgi:hypothetical protein
MTKRRFTDKDLEEIGWNVVDQMHQSIRPQPIQIDKVSPLATEAEKWAQQRRNKGIVLPKIGGV